MIKLPEKIAEDSIKHHLFKGDVLFWENYSFENGRKKSSRFVILTECKNDKLLVIRPTSRINFYEKSSNIYREFIKIPWNENSLFSKPTIFDLNSIYIFSLEKMKKIYGEQIKVLGEIPNSILEKLEALIKHSQTIRNDWITWILNSKKRNSK